MHTLLCIMCTSADLMLLTARAGLFCWRPIWSRCRNYRRRSRHARLSQVHFSRSSLDIRCAPHSAGYFPAANTCPIVQKQRIPARHKVSHCRCQHHWQSRHDNASGSRGGSHGFELFGGSLGKKACADGRRRDRRHWRAHAGILLWYFFRLLHWKVRDASRPSLESRAREFMGFNSTLQACLLTVTQVH
jgi:hypothetical protein